MKNRLQTLLRHNWRTNLLLCVLTIICNIGYSANTTYYFMLYKGNTNDYKSLVSQGSVTAENIFTWNLNVDSYGNYYFAVSTSSSAENILDPSDNTDRITNSTGGSNLLSSKERNNWSGKCMYRVSFATLGNVTLTYNKSGNSYTWAAASVNTTPTVRIGNKIHKDGSNNVIVSAYVAERGCNGGSNATISKFTVYYSKSSFSGTGSGVYSKEISASSPVINNAYDLSIPASELEENGWDDGDEIYVRVTATNATGESDMSDIVHFTYTLCSATIKSVTVTPGSKVIESGTDLNLVATANNTTGAGLTYTWYINETSSGTGSSKTISDVTSTKNVYVTASETTCGSSATSETQTYTVCSPAITNLSLSGCPSGNSPKSTGITFTASVATGTPTWKWYVDGNEVAGQTTSSYTFTPTAASDYAVKVVASGCPARKLEETCVVSAKSSFSTHNINADDFTACKDHHQFIWSGESGMFNPAPQEWDVTETGKSTSVKSEFEMLGSKYMVWKPGDKAAGSYSYTFTAQRAGYIDASAQLTITYAKTASAQGINVITINGQTYSSEPYPEVSPWTAATLATSIPGASTEITSIKWTVSPAAQISPTNSSATTAEFKGRSVEQKTLYSITATGLTATCGEGGSATTKIYVKPEDTERCD